MARDTEAEILRVGDAKPSHRKGAAHGPTPLQWFGASAVFAGLTAGLALFPGRTTGLLHAILMTLFVSGSLWRLAAIVISRTPRFAPQPLQPDELPPYTVIVPLYHEAEVVPELVRNLSRLDYPHDRLQVIIVLEQDDEATPIALTACPLPPFIEVFVAPRGFPKTKPRACNAALVRARGDLVVVYDAEDAPEPGQLREAAARFAAQTSALGCLQAPLRIREDANFVPRQFALEYAALFEVMLPALARLRLPFPLGGTSNHFRRAALTAVGGWDAYNVTEDADMGFRLAAHGYRLGMLTTPTLESAPDSMEDWLPQRARWVKGYMQTWGVNMRNPLDAGWRSSVALQITLGYAILSALVHGPLMAAVVGCCLVSITSLVDHSWPPEIAAPDLALLFGGWLAAVIAMGVGVRRAGGRLSLRDTAGATVYWPLQSLAAAFAIHQLVTRPFHWDKTRHRPVETLAPSPV